MGAGVHTRAAGVSLTESVLVIGFNRPRHLAQVIDSLRAVQPGRVCVAIDGWRPDREGERELVLACRELVSAIDWPCEVETLFQERNLGCGAGVTAAITWFLGRHGRGIILEDDIVADPSFFPFCVELLDRYEHDRRVFAVSGCNFVPPSDQARPELPYRFSQVPHIWGWATWSRAWAEHRLDIRGWRRRLPPTALLRRAGSLGGALYWGTMFELLARGEVDTWDGQLVLAAMANGQLTATSNVNLIRNIGFDELATHTKVDRQDLQPVGSARLPLIDVPVELDQGADAWTRRHHFGATTLGMMQQFARYVRQRKGEQA